MFCGDTVEIPAILFILRSSSIFVYFIHYFVFVVMCTNVFWFLLPLCIITIVKSDKLDMAQFNEFEIYYRG